MVLLAVAGCMRGGREIALPELVPVREPPQAEPGPWRTNGQAITNWIPPAITRQALIDVEGGAGLSAGAVPGLAARDVLIEMDLVVHETAAAGPFFRAEIEDGVLKRAYAVMVFGHGVNLWLLSEGQWIPRARVNMAVAPGEPHRLRVKVRRDRIKVKLDGKKIIKKRDRSLTEAGRFGVRAMQGSAEILAMNVKPGKLMGNVALKEPETDTEAVPEADSPPRAESVPSRRPQQEQEPEP